MGGTTADRVTLPVIVTADAATSYAIPAVPAGTYYFRVYAVVSDGLSPPSEAARVVASGSPDATGPPSGLTIAVDGSNVTLSWTSPPGVAPTTFQIEAGSAPGMSDDAVVSTVTPRLVGRLGRGPYYVRARALNGGAISAPSNEVSAPGATGVCTAAPGTPILLPASIAGGVVTLSWLPAAGEAANRYRLDVVPSTGGQVALLTPGAGTSMTAPGTTGTYAVRATALNACGASATSNEVSFVM